MGTRVSPEYAPVRDGADALAAGALRCERRASPGANQPVLILRRAVDHDPHEGVGKRVAVSLARGAYQAGACAHGRTLDLHGEHHVPGDAIALGDDEQARPMPAERRERRPQRRTIGDRGNAATPRSAYQAATRASSRIAHPWMQAR